jgi:hypothetical protein
LRIIRFWAYTHVTFDHFASAAGRHFGVADWVPRWPLKKEILDDSRFRSEMSGEHGGGLPGRGCCDDGGGVGLQLEKRELE